MNLVFMYIKSVSLMGLSCSGQTVMPPSLQPLLLRILDFVECYAVFLFSEFWDLRSVHLGINMGSDSSEAIQTVSSDQPKTVRVRFKLHKQCAFGQQFLIVGDDPNLGLWDPSEGVPLNWSEGHVWTTQVDVPCGKVISYKFVLEDMAGAVMWQPGPDRLLETWDTGKTISVSEDWDSPDSQIVVEEEPVVVDDLNQSSLIDEKAEEEGVNGYVPSLFISDDFSQGVVGEEGDDVMREELDGDEHMSDHSDEPVMLLVAENITEGKNSSASDGLMSVAGKEEEETTALGDHGNVAMSGSDSSSLKNETRVVIDDEDLAELNPGKDSVVEDTEASASAARDTRLNREKEILDNDVQWGRRALHKFLANLGFTQHS
ncbi:hypothetical protein SASPL_104021 [Salvia splendens]|uniref:CBM20 domain-containing protein n=1 Tax=Salvia splendens TaxID=180675 RepID=A0A8X8YIJ2_SALSN|nr:hypothetical protein SASPL_104021 [Salvia splendens]